MGESDRNRIRCQPVTLPDGTTVYARARGELTEQDRQAILGFYRFLSCRSCPHRDQCAIKGCAREAFKDDTIEETEGEGQ